MNNIIQVKKECFNEPYCEISNICKQLQEKEQECEELKEKFKTVMKPLLRDCSDLRRKKRNIETKYKKEICKQQKSIVKFKAENEELKRQHESDKGLITSMGKQNYQLLQEHDQLKAENEILEKVNKNNQEKIKKLNETLQEEFIAKQYGDEVLFFTLMDIKAIAESVTNTGSLCKICETNKTCADCLDEKMREILEKIKEVIKDEE